MSDPLPGDLIGSNSKPPEDDKPPSGTAGKKSRKWPLALTTTLIGAGAVIVAALITQQAGGITIVSGSAPSAGKTVTVPPESPGATVTVTASPVPSYPGPVTVPGCKKSQSCQAFNMVARPGSVAHATALYLNTGRVFLSAGGGGDVLYIRLASGMLELVASEGTRFSTDVTAPEKNMKGCQALTSSDPTGSVLTKLRQGLTFCVSDGSGVALVTETRPVGAKGQLYLRELYWQPI